MLYFRFDFEKEDFKGEKHKSVMYGYEVEDRVDYLFDEESEQLNGYYLNTYKELQEKYFDKEEISEEEYDEKIAELKKEFIKDELTLNGASCFELNEDGIDFSNNYKYDDRKIISIFEGDEIDCGHDKEIVAKCEKIIFQGNSKEIIDIFYDDDIEDKVAEVLKLINK